MPDQFQAGPAVVPPPTPLDPRRSQRFCVRTTPTRLAAGFAISQKVSNYLFFLGAPNDRCYHYLNRKLRCFCQVLARPTLCVAIVSSVRKLHPMLRVD
jgi:hypothetical protein